jgi:hypothetical protein
MTEGDFLLPALSLGAAAERRDHDHAPRSGYCTPCGSRHGCPIDRGRVRAEKRLSLSYTVVRISVVYLIFDAAGSVVTER